MDVQLTKSTGEALKQYYDAEKNALPVVISAAIFVLAIGIVLLKQTDLVSRGMGSAVLAVSLVVVIGAIVYSFQIGPQKAVYEGLLANDPQNYCSQEMAHLNKIQDNFTKIIGTDLIISLLGVVLIFLGSSQGKEFMRGFGIGLALMFFLVAVLENLNRMRLLRYRDKVESLQKDLAVEE